MEIKTNKFQTVVLTSAYLYLVLPMLIFFLGWCRWYIGVPAALIIVVSLFLCMKEHRNGAGTVDSHIFIDWKRIVGILVILLIWVLLSGVGGYVWQNSDHWWRNRIFEIMIDTEWPSIGMYNTQERGLVYYIGFWIVPALVGKLFGVSAGYAAQYIWTVIGIFIFYMIICLWRKKVVLWPLILFVFFSGLDVIGMIATRTDVFELFGTLHLESWSYHYQFSSVTTQLFWVFNQAVSAWIVCALVFLFEKPRNMIFIVSLIIMTATFPFVGLVPYLLYYMIVRSEWNLEKKTVWSLVKEIWENWGSVQNLLGGGIVAILSVVYVFGNSVVDSLTQILAGHNVILLMVVGLAALCVAFCVIAKLAMRGFGKYLCKVAYAGIIGFVVYRVFAFHYSEWQHPMFFWMNMTLFYFLEVGVFLLCLYRTVAEKKLFWINAVWLYVIPTIIIGSSCDFCMRASIPGILLIVLWCIRVLDEERKKEKGVAVVLVVLLLIGAITPQHEMKRTYSSTIGYYENFVIEEDAIFGGNNFSGSTDGFFWQYIAK